MLLVEHPLAYVFSAVDVEELALTVGHIVVPESIVHASVVVDEAPLAIGPVFAPVPFVLGPVPPHLHATALSLALLIPLPLVHRPIVELLRPTEN